MIRVYSKTNCIQCRMTKKELEKLGIEYEEINIEQSSEAESTVRDLGALAAPVVVRPDGTWFGGFRPDLVRGLQDFLPATG